jgi:small subunit ribosomal protein S16
LSVKIRLKRLGKIRAPYYRIVVADSKTKRDGRVIEEIGKYHPTENPSFIEINSERAQYWLGVGAQPTEQVAVLLKLSGDWGKFKGDKNAKSTIRVAEPKPVFSIDDKKKPVLKPKAEKAAPKGEAPVEAPAAEAPVEVVEETPAETVTEAEVAVDEATGSADADAPAEGAAADEAPAEAAAEGDDK